SPLVFQRLELFRGPLSDVRVRLGSPPLLLRRDNFGRAPAGEQLVDVGKDDVANGGLRTTDRAEIGGVGVVIGRLDFVPGEILPANDDVGVVNSGGIRRRQTRRRRGGTDTYDRRQAAPGRQPGDAGPAR